MKNTSVENLALGGFVAAAIVLVVLGGIAWRSAAKSDEASAQVMLTHQVLTTVGQISFNLARADTAQHGYDIYGENDYLKSRDESLLNVLRSVSEAEQIIVVPEQQEHLHRLKKMIAQRMEVFRWDHKARKANGQIVVASFNTSPPIMAQIHDAIGRIVEMENSRVLEREAENVFQRKVEYLSFALLGALLSLSLIVLFLRIRRSMRLICDEAVQLKQGRLDLEEESRNKSELLAHVSHELRTPINSIVGFSELLKGGGLGKLTKTQHEYIGDICSNSQHLLFLVNEFLDMSRIESGKMVLDLAPVEIAMLLDDSISIIKEQAATQHVRLNLKVQPGLEGILVDPLKVRQILYNLLSNALKFTSGDGQLKLRVQRVSRSDVGVVSGYWPSRIFPLSDSGFMEFLEISVADSGIGIAPEGLEQLFKPYSRIDNKVVHKTEGTGLGLVLVKLLAELHGGTVAVESAAGYGSRFIVWLPMRTNVEAAVEPEEPSLQQSASESIWKAHNICARVLLEFSQQRTFVNV